MLLPKPLLKQLSLLVITPILFSLSTSISAITLDGQLDDEEWALADIYYEFVTVTPFSLDNPEYRTEAKIFTNEEGIYVGITNFQPLSSQITDRSARDSDIHADSNTIIIDFDGSGISGYQFQVGNGGSIRDGIWRNENSFSTEWNGLWSAQTTNDEEHWYSEVFIPWDVAPMISGSNNTRTIGLHFTRFVADNSKEYASSPIDNSRQRFLSDFITTSIEDFATSSLQVFAYATGRQDRVNDENTYDAGVDIFWKPSSSQQLSLSINPDFGQVESDGLVVNFSPTETFFDENRPFFTENQAIFDLSGANGLRVLHTRRIGGRPDVGTEIGADIIAALKFTSVGDKLNYGFFSAIEDSDAIAEGRNYYAGRVVRKTDDYSLGYLLTYTDRPDIDRTATVQAVDYSYNFAHEIQLNGQLINTNIDSPTNNSSDNGGWISLQQQITDSWDHSAEISYYGDEFEINDLGFLGRNNLNTYNYGMGRQNNSYEENSILQSTNYGFNLHHEENTQGDTLNDRLGLNHGWNFKNTSNGFINFNYNTGGINDLVSRGNGSLNTDSGFNVNMIYFADRRKNFQWHLRGNYSDSTVGGNGYFLHYHPSYQFNEQMQLRVGATYTDNKDWLIWQGGSQLNAFSQERLLTEIEFVANFSTKQEFSLKLEWIALQATAQEAFNVNSTGHLESLNAPIEDFNLSDVAIQLHYRYEIAPLSNVYVVYSRGGSATTHDESSFSSLFSPGWEARDGDNFVVKVRYQF